VRPDEGLLMHPHLVVDCLTPGCGAVLHVLTPMPVSSFIVHCPECGKTRQYLPPHVRELPPVKDGQKTARSLRIDASFQAAVSFLGESQDK